MDEKKGIPNECLILVCLCLSVVSILLSFLAFEKSDCTSTTEVVLSLVGICATISVGASVYNAIEIHRELKDVREMAYKANEVERKILLLKEQSNILFRTTWGIHFMDKENCKERAFTEFWRGILIAAEINDPKHARVCIKCAKKLSSEITKGEGGNEDFPNVLPDTITNSDLYSIYQEDLKDIIEHINKPKKTKK